MRTLNMLTVRSVNTLGQGEFIWFKSYFRMSSVFAFNNSFIKANIDARKDEDLEQRLKDVNNHTDRAILGHLAWHLNLPTAYGSSTQHEDVGYKIRL